MTRERKTRCDCWGLKEFGIKVGKKVRTEALGAIAKDINNYTR